MPFCLSRVLKAGLIRETVFNCGYPVDQWGLSNDHENEEHEADALSCIGQGSGGVSSW
jgi:hypothetical protein